MTQATNTASEQKLVLRILHWGFLITTSFSTGELSTRSSVIRWRLPKIINPNNINADIELLSDHLAQVAAAYEISGRPMIVVMPHCVAPVRTIDIPMNLSTSADKKEYASSTKVPIDFWKEHDESLVDVKDAEIRAHYLYANVTEGSSRMLYCATTPKVIKNYTAILLGGGFYPTSFVPEGQALIKIIQSRLSRVEKEVPFCIFHLSKGNHKLIHCSAEEIIFSKVDISELDEILLEQMPAENDLENAFWTDITSRMNDALKQSVSYLRDESKVAAFETIFFVCDYDKEALLFDLFRRNFRLANLRSLSNTFTYRELKLTANTKQERKFTVTPEFESSSILMPCLACYSLKSAITSVHNPIIDAPLLNLHPQSAFIENNFKQKNRFKLTVFCLMSAILFFGGLDFYASLVSSKNSSLETEFKMLEAELGSKKTVAEALEKNIQSARKREAALTRHLLGKNNTDIIQFINNELPQSLELDSMVLGERDFSITGNSNSVSDINRFYERMLTEPILVGITINVYKRADSRWNYFEIVGKIRG